MAHDYSFFLPFDRVQRIIMILYWDKNAHNYSILFFGRFFCLNFDRFSIILFLGKTFSSEENNAHN